MNEELCWRAVEERDKSWAEKFVYGVLTTGVFCRPGCSSRRPLRRNVRFYRTAAEAAAEGAASVQALPPGGSRRRSAAREVCGGVPFHPQPY